MNGLIEGALGRSRTVLLALVFIILAGIITYRGIPKEAQPDVEIPYIYVSISHEGISPEDAERLLVRPMEQELRALEGVKEMTSSGYEGGANVTLEFDAGIDTAVALQDVSAPKSTSPRQSSPAKRKSRPSTKSRSHALIRCSSLNLSPATCRSARSRLSPKI